MRLLEYQGKEVLKSLGIVVPDSRVANTPEEAYEAAQELGGKVMIKVQIPTGGRGKAGGVKAAATPEEAREFAAKLLGAVIKGYQVKQVLVEKQIKVQKELYMGITIDNRHGKRVFMFCEAGGMDIEQVVSKSPERLLKVERGAKESLPEYQIRSILRQRGFSNKTLVGLSKIASALFEAFLKYDLSTCEINPLCILEDGSLVAADAKVEIDDSALYRQKQFQNKGMDTPDELELRAKEIGVTYVKLDGEIGILASGAGLGMCCIDLLADEGLKPANFLETGGGITRELMADAIELVVSNKKVKAILISLYGGVNSLLEAAIGIKNAKESMEKQIPIVVKAIGNQDVEAWEILREAGIDIVETFHTERAVQLLKEKVS